jgi:hypothetical protein
MITNHGQRIMTPQEYENFYRYQYGLVPNATRKTTDTTNDASTAGQDTEPILKDPYTNPISTRNGSPIFYNLLERMADLHDKKSYDYASNSDPFGNYHFAGLMSQLFTNPDDAGFVGRLGEKIFRLANLENSRKSPVNESIEDTELDICVIVALWIADRRDRRIKGGPYPSE